jgi:hypothetical protein
MKSPSERTAKCIHQDEAIPLIISKSLQIVALRELMACATCHAQCVPYLRRDPAKWAVALALFFQQAAGNGTIAD